MACRQKLSIVLFSGTDDKLLGGPGDARAVGEIRWETLHHAREAGTVRITACSRCVEAMGLVAEPPASSST